MLKYQYNPDCAGLSMYYTEREEVFKNWKR